MQRLKLFDTKKLAKATDLPGQRSDEFRAHGMADILAENSVDCGEVALIPADVQDFCDKYESCGAKVASLKNGTAGLKVSQNLSLFKIGVATARSTSARPNPAMRNASQLFRAWISTTSVPISVSSTTLRNIIWSGPALHVQQP
jgi:hypothetical protein